ncbi:MAG: adenylate/guanylate cyclase domain-containing protein [Myxococcales bacterium]
MATEQLESLIATLGMTDIIRLQNLLSKELTRRFEKPMAVAFSDVVGSTEYFARFGDEAGRRLQQRHFDLLNQAVPAKGGRVVDTAGDGAFLAFPSVDAAIESLIDFQKRVSLDNLNHPRNHQMSVRTGIHFGPVLTDGQAVTGDAVNLGSRVTSTASGGELRLTRDAYLACTNFGHRLLCRGMPPMNLKGISRPVDLLVLEWRDLSLFPASVVLEETGETFTLPPLDTITFGRLKEHDGVLANDIVLALPDPRASQQISRWHFELRRRADGFLFHLITEQRTEVDGAPVSKGQQVKLKPDSTVKISNVATLRFVPNPSRQLNSDSTLAPV